MALQDLTPQLRTRLSRLERLVGWFVTAATLLLVVGLVYYVYQTAQRRGWFLKKMSYYTFVRNASGLKIGDPVKLMGFNAGEIVEIKPQPPDDPYFNVFVKFRVMEPYYGYLWEDSRARVEAADFLGNRYIEVSKGTNGAPTYAMHQLREVTPGQAQSLAGSGTFAFAQDVYDDTHTNLLIASGQLLTQETWQKISGLHLDLVQVVDRSIPVKSPRWIWDDKKGRYLPLSKGDQGYWLRAAESPALTERLEKVIYTVETSLPNFLEFTNKLARVLAETEKAAARAEDLLASARPVATNLAQITAHLTAPDGSFGEWLIPTNLHQQLQTTLGSANTTVLTAQTNLNLLSINLMVSLENVANLTSNLHAQVEANGLILSDISDLVIHTDEIVQGLKRHWLLKSSFGEPTNPAPRSVVRPRIGGDR